MRYLEPVHKQIEEFKDELTIIGYRAAHLMRFGESASDAASRQKLAMALIRCVIAEAVTTCVKLAETGCAGDLDKPEALAERISDIEISIRQLFEDLTQDAWEKTKSDAREERVAA